MPVAPDEAELAIAVAAAGIETFGDLQLAPESLLGVIRTAIAEGVGADQLQARAAEIYLGTACVADVKPALAALDRIYISRVGDVLARKRLPSHVIDEIRQIVRERLLSGEPRYIGGAVGRGALDSLIAVIATRAAIDWLRANGRAAARHDDAAAADDLAASGDPARDHLRARYRAELKDAFEAAVSELEPRERSVLRLHLVDGLTIDDIAKLYQIHRATAARQIERARDRVAAETRKLLARTTQLHGAELLELGALVTSQLDLSLSRVLAVSSP
ncbi:MAG: putative DNA-binding regulatory protein [Myxococcales bacterium]|nr:putative DNA-binding regulatory protein [Myxococcales bacterium]